MEMLTTSVMVSHMLFHHVSHDFLTSIARLDTGFIYTFGVTADNEVQGFYAVTPPRVSQCTCYMLLLHVTALFTDNYVILIG